jgi:hydroxymethylbilane synthase
VITLATRSSPLARWQARRVADLLGAIRVEVELLMVETVADRRLDVPLGQLAGQGVFVKEVQAAVLDGRADAAVHSAKDLQSEPTAGLCIAAYPERADPRDALVGSRLDDLGPGATVATGSARRKAQLAAIRPDLSFVGLRGSIGTRLGRVPPGGAIVVASAALERLGLGHRADEVLPPERLLPQVAQGALAVECRFDDDGLLGVLARIDDRTVRLAVEAERAFLARLGGGCELPVAAHARVVGGGEEVLLDALLADASGATLLRGAAHGRADERVALGAGLADELLSRPGAAALAATLRR